MFADHCLHCILCTLACRLCCNISGCWLCFPSTPTSESWLCSTPMSKAEVQMLVQAYPHIRKMPNRADIDEILKSCSCSLALQLCQPSGNIPPAIGTKKDECAPPCLVVRWFAASQHAF